MTAFEAKNPKDMEFPAKKFFNQGLADLTGGAISPKIITRNVDDSGGNMPLGLQVLRTHSAPIIALIRTQVNVLPGIVTACFIYSALSAANTALYVASRALFGLTRGIRTEPGSGLIIRAIAKMATVESRTESPWWALLFSGLILFWLPFVHISGSYSKEEVDLLKCRQKTVPSLILCSCRKFLLTSVLSAAS